MVKLEQVPCRQEAWTRDLYLGGGFLVLHSLLPNWSFLSFVKERKNRQKTGETNRPLEGFFGEVSLNPNPPASMVALLLVVACLAYHTTD